jgi:hypothetical protein
MPSTTAETLFVGQSAIPRIPWHSTEPCQEFKVLKHVVVLDDGEPLLRPHARRAQGHEPQHRRPHRQRVQPRHHRRSNPVQPLAEYQSQLDPDPNHHFAAVNLQIFNSTQHGPPLPATMQGFIASYFNQQQNTAHSHDILYYFTPDKLPVLTTSPSSTPSSIAGSPPSPAPPSATAPSPTTARPSARSAWTSSTRARISGHLQPPARRRPHLQALLL